MIIHHMKRRTLTFLILTLGTVALGAFWLVSTSRAGTETPEYKVIRQDGDFEIRDYPALTIATTRMTDGGMDGSFGKLFRFITGSNARSEKIAMTTPVLIEGADEQRTMSFVMPGKTVGAGVPNPSGGEVTLGKMDAARFAVLRFRGGRTAQIEADAVAKLKTWLDAQKLGAKSPPIFAYYDPPWTPVFMRRNELMMRIGERVE